MFKKFGINTNWKILTLMQHIGVPGSLKLGTYMYQYLVLNSFKSKNSGPKVN